MKPRPGSALLAFLLIMGGGPGWAGPPATKAGQAGGKPGATRAGAPGSQAAAAAQAIGAAAVDQARSTGGGVLSPTSLGVELVKQDPKSPGVFAAKVVDPPRLAKYRVAGVKPGDLLKITVSPGKLVVVNPKTPATPFITILVPGSGPAAPSVPTAAPGPKVGAAQVQQMAQMNMQFLAAQQRSPQDAAQSQAQAKTQAKTETLSNASRARHDAAMGTIRNMK